MIRRGFGWPLVIAHILGLGPVLDADERAPQPPPAPPAADLARLAAAREKRARRGTRRAARAVQAQVGRTRAHAAIVARSLALFVLALVLASCAPEGPVDECHHGATRPCDGCSVGALRTNLPGTSACVKGDAGVTVWGPCRCAGATP